MKKIFFSIFFLLAIIPAMASDGTKFTVFGQVTDVDGTPINGISVLLSVSGSSISTSTANVTLINGNNASGYYVLELANLPSGANDVPTYVNEGTSMTITASTTGKSASWTGLRAASEPQEVNLRLSTGSSGGSSGGGGGGGGGGGSGGGTSGENFSNIVAKESREEFLAKDLPVSYNFTTPSFPVYAIVIVSTYNAGLINTQIELLKDRSSLVNINAPGTVYKYINIWVGTSGFATPKNIKEATIKFKVENSWLGSAGFKDADIVMLRWDGTQWLPLETLVKKKEGDFTHFEAKTNAFSPFAISAIEGGMPTPTTQITPITTTGTATPVITKEVPSTSPIKILIILLIIILLAVAGYLYYRKTRKK